MISLKPRTLQARFLLGLVLILACLGGFFALSLSMHLNRLVENEARDRAALILSQAEAVQSYVRNALRPAMYRALPDDTFVIEAMSTSYATRAVMNDNNASHDRFTYRRVAEGARNPDFEATDFERRLIARFREDPELFRIEEQTERDGVRHFLTASPVRFDGACLRCHGDPADAPPVLLTMYGAERGFWRKEGDLAGMTLVSLPMYEAVSGIHEAVRSFGVLFAGGAVVLFLVIQVFFNRLVVHNLRRMGGVMRRHFPDEASMTMPRRQPQDVGIDDLLGDMESLALHLREARAKLRDYAANLEGMVQERTVDLAAEATARRTDVELFVGLLDRLNRSSGKSELLAASLDLISRRFGADRAAYACVLSAGEFHAWPDKAVPPPLPEDWHELAAEGAPRLTSRAWFIPVQTSDTTRGLLCLYWDAPHAEGPGSADLAQAVGRQLGIAMDNLDALDNLLRQNALLDSIFEGISDPLLLLGGDGRIVLANSSARLLLHSLAGSGGKAQAMLLDAVGMTAGADEGPVSHAVTLPDGRSFAVNAYPLGGRLERGGRAVAYLRETTAERRMLERVQQHEKLAAMGKLAAGLAHEINNPLGVIHCYADLLRAAAPPGQARADLDVIMHHTEQAQKVVRDLLDFARPRQAEYGPCDVADVLAGLAKVLRPRARAAGASIVLDLPSVSSPNPSPDQSLSLPLVRADRGGLEQVVTNLLLNALDAVETAPPATPCPPAAGMPGTPEGSHPQDHRHAPATDGDRDGHGDWHNGGHGGGLVVLAARYLPDMGEVMVQVMDNGPGIPEEHLPRLFDPFFTTKAAGRGTGLGLTVTFGLIRDMGGRVEVRNLTPADAVSGPGARLVPQPCASGPPAVAAPRDVSPFPVTGAVFTLHLPAAERECPSGPVEQDA